MKRLVIGPMGWECTLRECPPGHFVYDGILCFKTEYAEDGNVQAYNEAGEFFWAGAKTHEERHGIMVQPVMAVWLDD